jgi:hypothetical protein
VKLRRRFELRELTQIKAPPRVTVHAAPMSTKSAQELRQRIAEYNRLRTLTMDKQAREALDSIIAETEERLRQLEAAPPKAQA